MQRSDGKQSGSAALCRTAALAALLSLAACGVTPRHEVLPYPDHIRAGIAVGDRVEIETVDGRQVAFDVGAIDADALSGDGQRVHYSDIEKLVLVRFAAPRNPCDTEGPLACSIPGVVTLLSRFHDEYRARFQPSCANHDLCYRYGKRTYGHERADCDSRFLADMKGQCRGILELDPLKRVECELAAAHLHDAVVRGGERAFRADDSRYCEYAGPPPGR